MRIGWVVIELVALALCGLVAVRVLALPAARRELREHPRVAVALAAAAAVATGIAAWGALDEPVALHVLAALATGATLAACWRAHPGYGTRRGLPPGTLGLHGSLRAVTGHRYLHAQSLRHGPVFKTAQVHNRVVCVVGLERGREALRRHAAVLRPAEAPLSQAIPKGFLRYMEPDDYDAYARRLRPAFTATISSTGPDVARAEAIEALERLAAGGAGVAPRPLLHDAAGSFSRRFLVGGLLDDDLEALAGWVDDVGFATSIGTPTDRARGALAAFGEALARRAAERPGAAGDSVAGQLLRDDPHALADETLRGNLFLLYTASRDSIGSLLAWLLYRLSGAPDWVERLRTTPPSDAPAGPAEPRAGEGDPFTWTVLESLRLGQSEYVYRRVLEPIEVEGFRVPRDWILRVCVAESHLLDPPFADPERFDPARFERGRFGPEAYAPFGLDRHACLGARMSMLLARTFVEELVHGFSWTVAATGPPERGNRHWHHWAPSARFRVELRPRAVSEDARAPAGSSSR